MANQTQDVELRIRASNYSKQTTDKVVDALKELTKAQDEQIDSAKKGTATVAQLEASYVKLENAAKALLSQQSLIKLFQAQGAALTELETKLAAARKAQEDYAKSLTPGAERTAKQEREMKKLGQAVAQMEKQYERAQNRIDGTGKRLAEYGITAATAADAQNKIVTAVTAANAALAKQEKAINGADAAAASRKAATEAIAQRELQVKVDNLFAQAERDVAKAQLEAAAATTKATAAVAAQQAALRAAADQAERTARGTNARGTVPVVGPNLTGSIRDIQNPADAAVRSIKGIDDAIDALEDRVKAIDGPIKDYKGALEDATRAQKALLAVAGQVDEYQRQKVALKAAGEEYGKAQRAVRDLVRELRSGAAGDDITTRLAKAQATLKSSAEGLAKLATQARGTRDALQSAGVDTRNLSAAEAALVTQANRATAAMNGLTTAYAKNGAAAGGATAKTKGWFSTASSAVFSTERLHGELLSLTAGFIGLNAAIELGKKTLDTYKTNQAIMSRLLISNGGDARKAGEDYRYLEVQADRIGFVFNKIAPAFTKFAIAGRTAGFSTQEVRFAFEQIATASVKARLGTEELEGVMKAFEQIMSKGTVQAEELRGQLGDRLPGAFQIAAKAANMTVEEYTKAVTLGEIGSEQVVAIARELGKTYGAAAAGASGLLEAQARFDNAANRFLTSTAEGGFVQAYSEFLAKLTNLLNSGQGDKLASVLSAGFTAVIDVMGLVADNIDGITLALKLLIGVGIIKWLYSLPAAFLAVRTAVIATNAQMVVFQGLLARQQAAAALTVALGTGGLAGVIARLTPLLIGAGNALLFIGRAIPVVGGILAVYAAATYVLDKTDNKIRDRVKATVAATIKATDEAQAAQDAANTARGTAEEKRLQEQADRLKMLAVRAVKEQGRAVAEARAKNVDLTDLNSAAQKSVAAARPAAVGTEDPGDRPGSQLKKLKDKLEAEDKRSDKAARSARMKSAKEELADRLSIIDEPFEALRKQYRESIKDDAEYNTALAEINKSSLKAQAAERLKFNAEQQKASAADGDKRVRLAEEIKNELASIEADIANKNAQADPTEPFEKRRAARVKAIEDAYDQLAKKIVREKQLNPQQAALDKARLDVLTKQREVLEGQNADRDEAARLADEFNKKQSILKLQLEEINALYETGQITPEKKLADTNAAISAAVPGLKAAGEEAIKFANQVKAVLKPVDYQTIISGVGSDLARLNADATIAGNNLGAQQTTLNNILAEQARLIDQITLKRKLGMITSEEEAALLNQNMTDFQAKIIANAAELLKLAEVARKSGAITAEAFNQIKGSVDNLTVSTKFAQTALSDVNRVIVDSVVGNGVTAFEALAGEIAKVATGAQSIGDGFKAALGIVGQFFASLLRDIALAIVKQLILKAITSAIGGPVGTVAGAAAGAVAGALHTGGVVGMNQSFARRVPAGAFMGAPRYHTGGLAGFAPNEVPAILEKNEEVLTRDDPRHVLNGGTGSGGGGDAGNRFVLVDDRANVPQAMASSAGEKVTLVHLKNNLSTLKQWMK